MENEENMENVGGTAEADWTERDVKTPTETRRMWNRKHDDETILSCSWQENINSFRPSGLKTTSVVNRSRIRSRRRFCLHRAGLWFRHQEHLHKNTKPKFFLKPLLESLTADASLSLSLCLSLSLPPTLLQMSCWELVAMWTGAKEPLMHLYTHTQTHTHTVRQSCSSERSRKTKVNEWAARSLLLLLKRKDPPPTHTHTHTHTHTRSHTLHHQEHQDHCELSLHSQYQHCIHSRSTQITAAAAVMRSCVQNCNEEARYINSLEA